MILSFAYLLQLGVGLLQLLLGGDQIDLHLDELLLQIADLLVQFVGAGVGILGLVLAGVGLVDGVILLKLHRLHLLLDGVHGVCVFVVGLGEKKTGKSTVARDKD